MLLLIVIFTGIVLFPLQTFCMRRSRISTGAPQNNSGGVCTQVSQGAVTVWAYVHKTRTLKLTELYGIKSSLWLHYLHLSHFCGEGKKRNRFESCHVLLFLNSQGHRTTLLLSKSIVPTLRLLKYVLFSLLFYHLQKS